MVLCGTLALAGSPVLAGALEPPVPPGNPTMKTLAELEPRRPIYAEMLPLTITDAGSSWYLAENIDTTGGGITIEVDSVTIDLNGFRLKGGTGIGIFAFTQLEEATVVKNGEVSSWSDAGITLGPRSVVENVIVRDNGGIGISVRWDSRVVGCIVSENLSHGIIVARGGVVTDCLASNNHENGIWAEADQGEGAFVTRCVADANGKNGIRVEGYALVTDNDLRKNGIGNPKAGVWVLGPYNRIEGNHITETHLGIDLDGNSNVIVQNTLLNNTTNLAIDAGATGNFVPTFVVGSPGDPADWDNLCVGTCP